MILNKERTFTFLKEQEIVYTPETVDDGVRFEGWNKNKIFINYIKFEKGRGLNKTSLCL